jgi:diguanylate cyclase (GGDEF)-like protein
MVRMKLAKPARPARSQNFSSTVVLSMVAAVILFAGLAIGFIIFSTLKSDDRALERQSKLVAHMLDRTRADMIAEQVYTAAWDDALVALTGEIDMDWVAENLGYGVFADFGYNRIYVLDPAGKPVYAMREGGDVPAESWSAAAGTVQPIVDRLAHIDAVAAISAYNNDVSDIPDATDIAPVEGRPALVSAVPILSETEEHMVTAGNTFTLVAVRFLDDALAHELTEQFLLDGAAFTTDPTPVPGTAIVPITDTAGNTVAWFRWQPDRPGAVLLSETLPLFAGALAIAAAFIWWLTRRLQRASAELEAARSEAQHRALHDPLTGLANRAMFQERLTHALERLNKGGDPVALLALDLDRFKQVNDTLGHEAGDELLRQVAQRLAALLSDNDTLARLGGDEFVILQDAIKTVAQSQSLSEKIIARVSEPYRLAGTEVRIGVSIGVALAADAARDGLDLPARADFALYQAKESGRNQYRFYDTATAPPPADATSAAA